LSSVGKEQHWIIFVRGQRRVRVFVEPFPDKLCCVPTGVCNSRGTGPSKTARNASSIGLTRGDGRSLDRRNAFSGRGLRIRFTLSEDGDCFQSQPLALHYQFVQTFGALILTYNNPLAGLLRACGAYWRASPIVSCSFGHLALQERRRGI
jgi:hypothetical protein